MKPKSQPINYDDAPGEAVGPIDAGLPPKDADESGGGPDTDQDQDRREGEQDAIKYRRKPGM